MANATVSRLGQANGAGDADALFLQVFGGEVLTAFLRKTVMMGRHVVRSISHGASAQFPATWRATAAYHTPGVELVGTAINHNERVITIDDVLIADVFIAQIDEAKNHYDVRGPYSRALGEVLAVTLDQHLLQLAILAARASATVTGGNGGTVVTDADAATNADSLIGSILDAIQAFDEKDVPTEDRYVFLKPAQYYMLVESGSKILSRDYNDDNGSLASGKVFRVGGAELVMTNNIPSTDISTGPTAYQGDFQTVVAAVMQRSAIGTVKLIDMAMESEYDIRRQGTLMLGKFALGSGILRPESAVEIKSS